MGNNHAKPNGEYDVDEAKRTKTSLIKGVGTDGIVAERDYTEDSDGSPVKRRLTNPETEVMRRKSAVDDIVSRMPEQVQGYSHLS